MTPLPAVLTARPQHYIDGTWAASPGQDRLDLVNPYSEKPFGSVALGTAADVDAAVQAARTAFPAWSTLPREERAAWIGRLVAALQPRLEPIAQLETTEMGSPIGFSRRAQAQLPLMVLASYAGFLKEEPRDELIGNSRVVREPIGVVAAITAWNYPLLLLLGKVAPAIAAGCTVVAKPSEIAPLTAMVVADALAEIGFPKGVINIVNGIGPVVGEALVAHPGVGMVSYTGSTATGRRLMATAAPTVKKLALELGGKSATVILDDAPLEAAVRGGVQGCFLNAGQTCIALSRMIVPAHLHAKALEIAADEARKFVPGDPMDEATTLGPLAFARHRERVQEYIRIGQAEGARLVTGGAEPPRGAEQGYFVQPTVFGEVLPGMRIAQEEIFGPVLSILPSKNEADAVAIANGTIYGLNGAVWSADSAHAVRVGRQLQCGKVDINGGGFNLNAPAGGFKQSGIGRERGRYAMEEFLQVKSLQFNDDELARASCPE
ncbi:MULTISPECIES: aldehyde dehydrogenase family protein [Comamonas]|uniref:aldehyde dehydrogenase family protein n=1 Tax=Comamonas TaxID=283 RepID=UPI0015F88F96|nr:MULTISPECIES: aldehyde dehydrogenase family protein [Comamonas]UUC95030.1 aldehyde dehydrogenase family protein [Comamonas sp. C11]